MPIVLQEDSHIISTGLFGVEALRLFFPMEHPFKARANKIAKDKLKFFISPPVKNLKKLIVVCKSLILHKYTLLLIKIKFTESYLNWVTEGVKKMMELLQETLKFSVEALASVLGFVALVLGFVLDSITIFYTEMPMLSGLVAGIMLSWIYTRRERHTALKVLSAPLKLLLDVMDLAWDQAVEFLSDSWEVCLATVKRPFDWSKGQLKKGLKIVMDGLSLIKVKLTKKSE